MPLGPNPRVSIVTPVFNNADDLPECIESVLAQTYQNWDYTIVNNCSTDGSGEIARRYAAKEPRIKVVDNEHFLRAVPNHNNALRQISPESKYAKIVFADDWIFPSCIEKMVLLAEENPSVGIIGAYGLEETRRENVREDVVMWTGLPYPSPRVSGRDVCRRLFLDGTYVFGTSTSLLYRSELVRTRDPFYNEANLHADEETCIALLRSWDFGFVHEILTFKRWRPSALGSFSLDFQTVRAGRLHDLLTYGRDFLSETEYDQCLREIVSEYYNFLAVSFMRGRRNSKFWDFHKRKLNETVGFSRRSLFWAILARTARMLLNPYETIEKLRGNRSSKAARLAAVGAGVVASPAADSSPAATTRLS
jgi:glycosyltransferase involved in cell wall biosynthesis